MKNKIADFIDTVLIFLALSLLGIICVGYFTKNISVILLCGCTSSLAVTFFISLFKHRKALPTAKQKMIDDCLTQFIFSSQEFSFKFIFEALSKKYQPKSKDNVIIIKNTAVAVHLVATPLTLNTLAEYYANQVTKVKRLIFFTAYGTDSKTSGIADTLPDIKIEIWQFSKVYDLLKSLGSLPENKIVMVKKKNNIKIITTEAFSVNKTKKYLIAALLLLASSLFMPYGIYYIIVASILITAAILCRIDVVKLYARAKKQK